MELIFKLPENKHPFIGIRFENVKDACTINRDFVEMAKDTRFNASVIPGSTAILNLICENPYSLRVYRDLKFDHHHLKVFQNRAWNSKAFNFGHVLKKFDHDELVQTLPGLKNFVIKLNDFKIIDF